ncbi:MAG: hypothetical protein SCK57_04510 [Bacillota bacterium]|nr:hypothetical protein [Bacillota bacterium]MDW7676904.1 hypothetical protein [Bacillota bacterium]
MPSKTANRSQPENGRLLLSFFEHYTINREQIRRIFERKKQLEGDVTQDRLKALFLWERYAYDITLMDLAISINMEHD